MFYKRPNENEWRGPGRVIGQDGVIVFVRHGSQLVRVHVCRMRKVQDEMFCEDERKSLMDKNTNIIDVTLKQFKSGQNIRFQEEETTKTAVVLGRAGKGTGKYKNWFNLGIKKTSGEYKEKAVDISKLSDLEIVQDNKQTLHDDEVYVVSGDEFLEAKVLELDSWKENGVYTEVIDEGQQCISTRWVCSWKDKDGKKIPKARLVIRGFEEQDKDLEKASPTCSSEGLKMVLAIMAQNEWYPKTMDIKTAFLQGNKLERDVFVKPPLEKGKCGILWKLEKCVYGLVDASLYWYKRVKDFMKKIGGGVSCMDPAIFFWINKENKIEGILACHVDDFLYGGNKTFSSEKALQIRKELTVGKESEGAFKYVGMYIQELDHKIYLNQNAYAESLSLIELSKERSLQKQCPVTDDERKMMKAKIGQLLWLGRQTRPDVIFDASELSTRVNKATVQDLIETNKIMRKTIGEKVTLKFEKLEKPIMKVFSDASLGNSTDSNTQGGYFICLQGQGSGSFTPLAWSSKKLCRVARSTLTAETLAMADAMDNGIFLASLYTELMTGKVCPEFRYSTHY